MTDKELLGCSNKQRKRSIREPEQGYCNNEGEFETYSATSFDIVENDENPNPIEKFDDKENIVDFDLVKANVRVLNNKYFQKMYLSSNIVKSLKVETILDTGSQVCLISKNCRDKLNIEEDCNQQIRIRDLSNNITIACPISSNIHFGYYKGSFSFYVVENLKETVGAEILVGLDLVEQAVNDDGIFPLFFWNKIKKKKKSKRKTLKPKYFRALVPDVVKSFKEFGNLEEVCKKFNISKRQAIKAIIRYKNIKSEDELLRYLLKRFSKVNSDVYSESELQNVGNKNMALMETYFGTKTKKRVSDSLREFVPKAKEAGKKTIMRTGEFVQDVIRAGSQDIKNLSKSFRKTGDFYTTITYRETEEKWNYNKINKFVKARKRDDGFEGIIGAIENSEFYFKVDLVEGNPLQLQIEGMPPQGYRTKNELVELKQTNAKRFRGLKPYKRVPWKFNADVLVSLDEVKRIKIKIGAQFNPNSQHEKLAMNRIHEIIRTFDRFFKLR